MNIMNGIKRVFSIVAKDLWGFCVKHFSEKRKMISITFILLSAFTHIGNAQTAPSDTTTISALKGVWLLDSMSCSLDGQKTESLFTEADSLIQIAFLLEEHKIETVWEMQSFRLKDKSVSQTVEGYFLSENTLELILDAGFAYHYGWTVHTSGVLELQRIVTIMQGQQLLLGKHNYYYTKK
jgi:hypothetical protein